MKQTKCLIVIVCVFLIALIILASIDQMLYERRVVIKYAAPGSNPALANGFDYTIPENGTWQAELIMNRPSISIQWIPILIDIAIGVLFEDPKGILRRGSKKYSGGPWRHSIADPFITFKASKNQKIRIWYSSSIGGIRSPDMEGKVRIFRIE